MKYASPQWRAITNRLLNANPAGPQERRGITASICSRVVGEQTKTARHGPPRVGNGSGGRLDGEEQAHGRGEHGGAGEGSAMDLGEGGAGDGDWVE